MKIPEKVLDKTFELENKILDIYHDLNYSDLIETQEVIKKDHPFLNLTVKDLSLYRQLTLEIIDENFEMIKKIYYKISNRECFPKELKKWLDQDWEKEI